ncbi:MAG: hypothetical protein KME23_28375 [Goleter apudmare HA4340-LM2]|jgi:Uma2 family endonuclease|nr:hypothetical protein [Goleter apudmare HA4340-LM2]
MCNPTLCVARANRYQMPAFRNDEYLISSVFADLRLTAQQVFTSAK